METAVLLIQCADQRGIVARVTDFVFRAGANITHSNQHSTGPNDGRFFMRLEFCFESPVDRPEFNASFAEIGAALNATWDIHYESDVPRMPIAVSAYDHCLVDLLYRVRHNELRAVVPCVISNHETMREYVEDLGIPFHHLPATKETRPEQERKLLEIIRDNSDFLVLARYMQILSGAFLDAYGKDIINIHHSFLPSFKGANPYRQAYERGVKLIGATAHYATTDLDEGPIIHQVVGPVSHRDNVETLRQKGRVLEQQALAEAVQAHIEHRVLRYENKTIVFR